MSLVKARQIVNEVGAPFMDDLDPEWFHSVDVNKLSVASSSNCVLAQWYEANHQRTEQPSRGRLYSLAVMEFALAGIDEMDFGFVPNYMLNVNFASLTRAWKEAIIWRETLEDLEQGADVELVSA